MPLYHYKATIFILVIFAVINSSRCSLTSTGDVQSSSIVKKTPILSRPIARIASDSSEIQDVEIGNDIPMLNSAETRLKGRKKAPREKRIRDESKRAMSKDRVSNNVRSTSLSPAPMSADKWTVEINGNSSDADQLAAMHNCNNLGLVKGFSNIYLFKRIRESIQSKTDEYSQRIKRDFIRTADNLRSHANVIWVEPQYPLTRVKRSAVDMLIPLGPDNVYAQQPHNREYQQTFLPDPHSLSQQQYQQYLSPSTVGPTHGQQFHSHYHQQLQQSNRWKSSATGAPDELVPSMYKPHATLQQQQVLQSTSNGAHFWPSSTARMSTTSTTSKAPNIYNPNQMQSEQAANDHMNQYIPHSISVSSSVATIIPVDSKTTNFPTRLVSPTKTNITNHHLSGNVRDVFSRGRLVSIPVEERSKYDDELWMHQWYLQDNSNNAHLQTEMHLHVQDVWKMGITGKNVVVTVIDDGLEWNHTDLIKNYDPNASYDMNNDDADPFPRYDPFDSNNHGTRCAGEIAMVSNNKKCGVGVAPDARIGGIKALDGTVEDQIESMSLLHNLDYIDIYSSSWGPKDDGITLEGPGKATSQALEKGALNGRKGRGAIYVWANGNGGLSGDNCNCDGYVSSPYTLAVGSVTQKGQFPFYGERCASTLAVTCSSGTSYDKKITTTDLHNRCTTEYSGTSAAGPLAAGIMALALEANPNITWRDAQHLVAWTADYYPLKDNNGWFRNNVGLLYNNKFGFGLMNAKSLVSAALIWKNVPQKSVCVKYTPQVELPIRFNTGSDLELLIDTDGCEGKYFNTLQARQDKRMIKNESPNLYYLHSPGGMHEPQPIYYLEHVQLMLTIEYPVRGDIDIFLTSPKNTTSNILTHRPYDKTEKGFTDWPFMSVHFWGEQPQGTWTLRVRDKDRGQLKRSGFLINATLILHGTTMKPDHMSRPRIYDEVDQINLTAGRSEKFSYEIYDENPWDQNRQPNDMSQVSNDPDEERFVMARIANSEIHIAS